MKASSYIIAGLVGLVAAVVIYRAVRRKSVPAQNAALDPNAWSAEYGNDASAQWVYDTYIRKAA